MEETSSSSEESTEPEGREETPRAEGSQVGESREAEGVDVPRPPESEGISRGTSEPEPLRLGRVMVVGLGVACLHLVLILTLYPLFSHQSAPRLLLGVLPYLLGGIALSVMPRRTSLLEVFYSAVIPAVTLPLVGEVSRVYETNPEHVAQAMERVSWNAVWGVSMGSVLLAMFACRVGEWLTPLVRRRGKV